MYWSKHQHAHKSSSIDSRTTMAGERNMCSCTRPRARVYLGGREHSLPPLAFSSALNFENHQHIFTSSRTVNINFACSATMQEHTQASQATTLPTTCDTSARFSADHHALYCIMHIIISTLLLLLLAFYDSFHDRYFFLAPLRNEVHWYISMSPITCELNSCMHAV